MRARLGYVLSGALLAVCIGVMLRNATEFDAVTTTAFILMVVFDLADLNDPGAGRVSLSGVFAIPLLLNTSPGFAGALIVGSRAGSYLIRRIRSGSEVAPGLAGSLASVLAGWGALAWSATWPSVSGQGAIAGLVVGAALLTGDALGRAALVSLLPSRFGVTDPQRWVRVELPLLSAALSLGVLAVVLVSDLGAWSFILTALVLALVRQAYGLLFDMRGAYHATLRTLVSAVESQNVQMRGHAEGTSTVARRIALKMRLSSAAVERVTDAALLHDIGELGEGERRSAAVAIHELEHLNDVGRVLEAREQTAAPGRVAYDVLRDAFVVSLASDVECIISRREHESPSASATLARSVPPHTRARVVSAAVSLGYPIPAVP